MTTPTASTTRAAPPAPGIAARLREMLAGGGALLRLLLIAIALFLAFSLALPNLFPTARNLQSMAFQASEIGILATAVALTMLTGGIDLSINATANLSGILAGLVLTSLGATSPETAVVLAVGVALLTGLACGTVNGLLVAYVGIPPILATLGTLTLFTGVGTVITRGAAVFGIDAFKFIGAGDVFGIPNPLIILLIVVSVMGVIVSRTRYGYEVYLLGTNPTAARFAGINTRRVLLRTYILSGIMASIAGMIILGRTNAARIDFGDSYVLLAIMLCVLAGIDPAGGSGRLVGIVLALAGLQFLSTGLNMLLRQNSGANFFRDFAWGALLLGVLVINYFATRARRRGGGR
jgi:simple sugar transport system permease protein